jgi:hypothetical protein
MMLPNHANKPFDLEFNDLDEKPCLEIGLTFSDLEILSRWLAGFNLL